MNMIRPIVKNKRNQQFTFSIPKKQFPELIGKNKINPKFIKIKEIEFFEDEKPT